jgi:DMSO/TMAO reductase YedYZ molybdopterin-dependent catalytic subunit
MPTACANAGEIATTHFPVETTPFLHFRILTDRRANCHGDHLCRDHLVERNGSLAQSAPSLTVSGEVHIQLTLSAADLAAMPRASAAVVDEHGAKATYQAFQ